MSNQNVQKELQLRKIHEKREVIKHQCHRGEIEYYIKETEIARIRAQLANGLNAVRTDVRNLHPAGESKVSDPHTAAESDDNEVPSGRLWKRSSRF
jgi:hypothetical protein